MLKVERRPHPQQLGLLLGLVLRHLVPTLLLLVEVKVKFRDLLLLVDRSAIHKLRRLVYSGQFSLLSDLYFFLIMILVDCLVSIVYLALCSVEVDGFTFYRLIDLELLELFSYLASHFTERSLLEASSYIMHILVVLLDSRTSDVTS